MEIDEDLIDYFCGDIEHEDIVVKFQEVYPHEDVNLLHCMAVHCDEDVHVPNCLERDMDTRCCTHGEYHPIITTLSNKHVGLVKELIHTYGVNDYMRVWKGTIHDNDHVSDKPQSAFDIILEYDNLALLKVMLRFYQGHLYPILRVIKQKYPQATKCFYAVKELMKIYNHGKHVSLKFPGEEDHNRMDHEEDCDEMDHEDEDHGEMDHEEYEDFLNSIYTPNERKMFHEIIIRNSVSGCWKSDILNRIFLDVINVACYRDGLNNDLLKVSALCMLKDLGHEQPENECPNCKHLICSQNNESRNRNTESESANQNNKPESKTIDVEDLFGNLTDHQKMIRHLCRAALLELKDENKYNENTDVIKHGIFYQHEDLFLAIVKYVCNHLVDRLDFAAINEALLTRTMMTQMFLEYGVEDDRAIEELKKDEPLSTMTMTQKIFSQLHELKWPPQEIETSKNDKHNTTVQLVKRHLQTLLAYGFLNPNAIDLIYLIDIHRNIVSICLPLLNSQSHYKLRLECQEQKRELEGKCKEKKDEGRMQALTGLIEKCNKSVVASLQEMCTRNLYRIMKKEEKSLPIEVASMDLSKEQKKYLTLGVEPFSTDVESNNQNMESESNRQNMESESNRQNMKSESSRQNMGIESNNQNMKNESNRQNMESESSTQTTEAAAHNQNIKELRYEEEEYIIEWTECFQ